MNFEFNSEEKLLPGLVLLTQIGLFGRATTAFSLTASMVSPGSASQPELIEALFASVREALAGEGCDLEPLLISGAEMEQGGVKVCGTVSRLTTRHKDVVDAIRAAAEAVHIKHGVDVGHRVWVTRPATDLKKVEAIVGEVYCGDTAQVYCNYVGLELLEGLVDNLEEIGKARALN